MTDRNTDREVLRSIASSIPAQPEFHLPAREQRLLVNTTSEGPHPDPEAFRDWLPNRNSISESSDVTAPQTQRRTGYAALWTLGGLSPWRAVSRSFRQFHRNQLDARSAQFAYYSILALAPFLIVIVACVAQLPLEGIVESFLRALNRGFPETTVNLIQTQLNDVQENSTTQLIALGLFLLSIAGSRVFITLEYGLDSANGITNGRHFLKSGLLAISLTFGVLVLLLLAMILLVVGPLTTEYLTQSIETAWVHLLLSDGVRWTVACGFMLIAASVVYWLVPSRHGAWYWLSPGSVVATGGWVLVTQGLRMWVEGVGSYNETYGALAAVLVLLVWLYLTGMMFLYGGQLNAVILNAARELSKPGPSTTQPDSAE